MQSYRNILMKKNQKYNFDEKLIIDNYLSKLNFGIKGTFNFKNDASFIELKKNKKIVVTTDSISENLDFFKNDDPKSIANKISTINLSDLSAMGVEPFAYTLNLFLPNYISKNWLNIFTKELMKIQKKYNFYLLGGDLSKSNKLQISSTFFGSAKSNKIIHQNFVDLYDDIWITGNLGDSYIGLQFLKNKINIKDEKLKNYFINKYYYPKPCMLGSKISKYVKSMKDISDGFFGDLKKMLNNNYGANINLQKIPISIKLNKIIIANLMKKMHILNTGDNYDLIVIANNKNRNKILSIAKKNKVKITLIGNVTSKSEILDDSNYSLDIPKEFDHFC